MIKTRQLHFSWKKKGGTTTTKKKDPTFQINTNQLEDQLVPMNEHHVLSQSWAFPVGAAEKTLFS